MTNTEGKKSKKTLFIILGVILALIILVMAFGGDDESGTDTAANNGVTTVAAADGASTVAETTIAETEKTSFVVGETYSDQYCSIAFTGANDNFTGYNPYSDVPSGMKVVQATFDFSNTGSSDFLASDWDFTCYADNVSCEDFYGTDDSSFSDNLSPGRQANGRNVYFLVPENAQSIILEYELNFWSEKKIQFIIK